MRIVIASVDYADFLAVTLPGWCHAFPEASITVVTAGRDRETRKIAAGLGALVLATEAWYRPGAVFDKGAALAEALSFGGSPAMGEVCLSVDADVYPFGTLDLEVIEPTTLYGCARHIANTPAEFEAHVAGATKRRDLPLILPKLRGRREPPLEHRADRATRRAAARACMGYFQLWRHDGRTFAPSKTAGGYDRRFRDGFTRRVGLLDFYVVHLGDANRRNWRGRVLPRWGTA